MKTADVNNDGIARTAPDDHGTQRAGSIETTAWWQCLVLLVSVLLICNFRLLTGKVAPQWDAADFFGPAFSLVSDHIHAHKLLLWDPWISGGAPDFAEPELGTSSPILLAVAIAFNGVRAGFVAYWIAIWIAAGLGMLLLTRHLKCPAWGGIIAALAYVTSGFFLGHSEHISSLYSVAFLPWMCWRLDDALGSDRYWSAVQAGVLYGLSGLGGYPQFTILTAGFVSLWALGRVLFADATLTVSEGKTRLVPAVLKLALVGAVGTLILLPPYLGIMSETRGYSDRVGERSRIESINSNRLPVGALSTLASPYISLLSYPGLPGRLWSDSDIAMCNVYAGSVVSVLALLALLRKSPWRWWLALLACLFLCAALGGQLPLRGWLYDFVSPTRYFRNSSMFSSYSIFVFCILAAYTARDWHSVGVLNIVTRRKFLGVSLLLGLTSVVVFARVVYHVPQHPFAFHAAISQLAATWIAVLMVSILLCSNLICTRSCVRLIMAIAVLDACFTLVVSRPVMYTTATAQWWELMDQEHSTSLDLRQRGLSRQLHVPSEFVYVDYPNNRNIPSKVAVLESYTVFHNRFELALQTDPKLLDFALGQDRLWFASDPVFDLPNDAAFARFAEALRTSGRPLLILHTPGQMKTFSAHTSRDLKPLEQNVDSWSQAVPALPASVELLKYTPNRLSLSFTSPEKGWLLVTDRWAPGWRAEVNGKPVEVYGANFLFRGVPVDAGSNVINFRYQPKAVLIATIVSWSALLIFAVLSVFKRLFILTRTASQENPPYSDGSSQHV